MPTCWIILLHFYAMNPKYLSTKLILYRYRYVYTYICIYVYAYLYIYVLQGGLSLCLLNQFCLKTLDFCSSRKIYFSLISEQPLLTMLLILQGSTCLISPIQVYWRWIFTLISLDFTASHKHTKLITLESLFSSL